MNRRTYTMSIQINGQAIKRVVIDPHYELKHASTISDVLILDLVRLLDEGDFAPEVVVGGYEYYTTDDLILKGKKYRLVWLIAKEELYIGVVNAYRRKA